MMQKISLSLLRNIIYAGRYRIFVYRISLLLSGEQGRDYQLFLKCRLIIPKFPAEKLSAIADDFLGVAQDGCWQCVTCTAGL